MTNMEEHGRTWTNMDEHGRMWTIMDEPYLRGEGKAKLFTPVFLSFDDM